jgi:SAM-dependent methyltransferase
MDPVACVAEVHRVLKPGGLVYSDAPFLLEVHAGAFDYLRFTGVGHRNLFREFEALDSGVTQGPGVALSHAIQSFLLSFVRRDFARFAVKAACRTSLFWLRYFDFRLAGRPGAIDGALGTYFTGRKDGRTRPPHEILGAYRGIAPDLHPRGPRAAKPNPGADG